MSRLATLLSAAAISFAALGLGACGGSDEPDPLGGGPPPVTQTETTVGGVPADDGGAVAEVDRPDTCIELRRTMADYRELWRELGCRRQRRALCRGLIYTDAHYLDYTCNRLKANKKAAAKRKAAKRRAAARKAAKQRAERKADAAAAKKSSQGSKSKSRKKSSSGSSSGGGSSSSASSRPSRSSSSGGGSSSRRR